MLALHDTKRSSVVGILGVLSAIFNAMSYVSALTIMISTGIGAISGLVQLILYAYYWYIGENNVDDDAHHVLNPVVVVV
ncbi:unnamed protein product [Trifolium pratense]|nr:unnamed protein product [Trifolium pratense]